jgi:molecular chaperone GrpE
MAEHESIRTSEPRQPDDLGEGFTWRDASSANSNGEQKPAEDRDSLRRALRDLEAAEARVVRNAERVYDDTRSKLVMDLLPILDNLDRAIQAAEEESDAAVIEGVRMVRTQLLGVLQQYGVERIDTEGQRFDPRLHEAITAIPVKDPRYNGVVIQQLAPGFRFGDKLLRPAKVAVGRFTG